MKQRSLNEWSMLIHKINREKGFWDKERNTGEMLMLVVSELSEALEADRENNHFPADIDPREHVLTKDDPKIKACFEVEIADAVIRLLDMCSGMGIDLEAFIDMKVNYNMGRPRLHGKNY